MGRFWTVLAMSWAYRGRLLAAIVFAVLGALLWGANISAVYPLMEVLFREQNVQRWFQERASHAYREAAQLEQELLASPSDALRARIAELQWQAAAYTKLGKFASDYLPEGRFETLVLIVCLSLVGMTLAGICRFLNEWLVGNITQRTMYDLRARFYFHVLRLDLAHFTRSGSAELMARFTNDMEAVSNGIKMLLGRAIREPLRIAACIGLACWINWKLTVLTLVLVPGVVALLSGMSSYLRRATRRHQEAVADMYRVLQEAFQAIKIVKVFRMEPHERRRFLGAIGRYYRRAMRIVLIEAALRPMLEVAAMAAVAGGLLVGGYLVISGETTLWGIRLAETPMTTSTLTLVYAALLGIMDPVRKLSKLYGRIQAAQTAAARVFEFMEQRPTIDLPVRGAVSLPRHRESIEFDRVWFEYVPGVPVVKDVSLRIEHGETVAFVGPNGSGKSTLLSLIPRLYDPTRGTVRIDGHDLRTVKVRSLRDQIGFVTQEVLLFDDTIFNNILYGKPTASAEEVYAAARQAFADEFIRALPMGYETRVGEHGARLSGGQRQRIALARVILRNPAIVILDEATSAVDAESKQLIQRALAEFCRGRTTLVITHRLDTLAWVDRVVVMDHGVVESVGPPELIRDRSQVFARLARPSLRQSA